MCLWNQYRFGPLCDTKISADETAQLQYNLIISHAVGVGKPIDKELSKIMMIAKVHVVKRFSGVSLEVIERLILMLERYYSGSSGAGFCRSFRRFGSFGASCFTAFRAWKSLGWK
jgi:histidine ammonia-lyase